MWYLLPLIVSASLDYFMGKFIFKNKASPQKRKLGLGISICTNLSLLIFFKILQKSFVEMSSEVHFGIMSGEAYRNVLFPIGISFYTFQTISYSWDIYRGRIPPENNFIRFLLYVSFFPQLMAGPIEKARNLLPQFSKKLSINLNEIETGFYLILLGLFKKVYVSNLMIHYINRLDPFHENPFVTGLLMCLVVYTDFSGYSDMARGLARWFGVHLMINFKPFYFSRNPLQFWSTWNRSLMAWIRDYLFLSFKSKSTGSTVLQTYIFLVLIGIWHDIQIHWVAFGVFHASMILFYKFIGSKISAKFKNRLLINLSTYSLMIIFYSFSGNLHLNADFKWIASFFDPSNILNFHEGWYRHVDLTFILLFICLFIFEFFQVKAEDYDFLTKKSLVWKFIFVIICGTGIYVSTSLKQYGFVYFMF